MKSKVFRFFLLFLPALFILILGNFLIDPANIYHVQGKKVANTLLSGRDVITGGNTNEREIKKYLIAGMPQQVDCVALGPSLSLTIDSDMVGAESFYNLSMSGANYIDIMAQLGMLQLEGKHANRVILCLDTGFFDEAFSNGNARSAGYEKYAAYMKKLAERQKPRRPSNIPLKATLIGVKQLFSISYFQTGMRYFLQNGPKGVTALRWREKMEDESAENSCIRFDGSYVYGSIYRRQTEEDVIKQAEQYDIDTFFSRGKHLNPNRISTLEQVISYLNTQGTEVEIYLAPMAPALWDRVAQSPDEYASIQEITDLAMRLSKQYKITVAGSQNPYDLNLTNRDFYDARHIRSEVIAEKIKL